MFELQYDLWNGRQLSEAKQTADMVLNLPNNLSATVNCKNVCKKRPNLAIVEVIVKGNIKLLRFAGYR